MARVRMNRGERRTPFLSNTVKGHAEQVAPNGCTYDGDYAAELASQADGIGAFPIPMRNKANEWGGNRSGE